MIRYEVQRYLSKHYVINSSIELWRIHIDLINLFNCDSEEAKSHILHYLSDKTDTKELLEYEYPYEFLNAKLSECTTRVTDENTTQYINKDGDWIFNLDLENKYFWVKYSLVWAVFENRYTPKYSDIQGIIKTWLLEAFKLRDVRPATANDVRP